MSRLSAQSFYFRFENKALEIAELKVEGFGRVCDTQTTF